MYKQVTSQLLMVRPANFSSNTETQETNKFQLTLNENDSQEIIQSLAVTEFDNMIKILRDHQITIIDVDDIKELNNTDAVFPNNWVSFHNDGTVVLYPMEAENRRLERREDIFDNLVDEYGFCIKAVKDFTTFEDQDRFLDGTGSMVLDRENKLCYAALSIRTD